MEQGVIDLQSFSRISAELRVRPLAICLLGALWLASSRAAAATNMLLAAAMDSVTSEELYRHVEVLADDVYEGRDAGSRGGYAAARYIVNELRSLELQPAGAAGDFVQPFNGGWQNVLALFPGDDPEIAQEIIVVGAHYDHVGYGRRRNSLGPFGRIHNGADDNASGVSLLLEVAEALAQTGLRTRRSILFAFWDGEERGLVGSRHWLANPTVPLDEVKLSITTDMVGRMRNDQLFVFGTRTGYGLRRLMSGSLDEPLHIDFPWELQSNSDHWSFVEGRIPVVMLHTGLHPDYHRPSDDAERINRAGMRQIGRYLLATMIRVANEDRLPRFREEGRRETERHRRTMERPLEPLSLDRWPANMPRPRLGISWREDLGEPGSVIVTRVVEGTPAAAAGIALHDRIYEINGRSFADAVAFQKEILSLLESESPEISLQTERDGNRRTIVVKMTRTSNLTDGT